MKCQWLSFVLKSSMVQIKVLVFGVRRKKENTSWEGGSAEGNFSLSV